MDLMDTVTRNRAWTLPQSNTGLCNIPTNKSTFSFPNNTDYKNKHRKHRAKSYKRKSKKHQHITNTPIHSNKPMPKRRRSTSRPRLSQARLFEIEDKEINAKRKKKEEFMVNREKMKERRQSIEMNTPPNNDKKRSKKLCYIKEDTPTKPSTKKYRKYDTKIPSLITNTKNPRKNRKKTLSATSIGLINKLKQKDESNNKPQSAGSRTHNIIINKTNKKRRHKRNKTCTLQSIEDTKPKYKYRGKGRYHNRSPSHFTRLNESNQSIKDECTPSVVYRKRIYHKKKEKKPNSCTMRSTKKKISQKKRIKKRSNGRYGTYKTPLSTSATLAPTLQLSFDSEEELSVSPSLTSFADSDIEFLGFSPHGRGRSQSAFQKPTVKIVYSPRINEAVFVGYKSSRPSYGWRGRGNHTLDVKSEDLMVQKSPSPQPNKFTFTHIKSKYKPHRIKWSTKTGFTDSELDDDDDNDNGYADNLAMFTFSDSESKDGVDQNEMKGKAHRRAKTVQINALLANLLSDEDIEEEECDDKQFKIVIDEIQHDRKGNDIYIGSVTASDDEGPSPSPKGSNVKFVYSQDGGNELLFDIESFVNNLSKKRSQLENNDDID